MSPIFIKAPACKKYTTYIFNLNELSWIQDEPNGGSSYMAAGTRIKSPLSAEAFLAEIRQQAAVWGYPTAEEIIKSLQEALYKSEEDAAFLKEAHKNERNFNRSLEGDLDRIKPQLLELQQLRDKNALLEMELAGRD